MHHPPVPPRSAASASMTSRRDSRPSSVAVPPVEPVYATRDVTNLVVLPTTVFTTQAPQLAAEKAQATALFVAYEALRARVAAWSTRLAQELASSGDAYARAPTVEAPPTIGSESRRASSPGRSSAQTAGERDASDPSVSGFPFNTELLVGARRRVRLEDPSSPYSMDATSTTTSLASRASDTSTFRASTSTVAAAPTPESGRSSPTHHHPPTVTRTPTATCVPPWIDRELDAFFHESLARAIQTRETQLVNTLHACAQQELQAQARRVAALEHEQSEYGKWRDHLQSKLDRRVAETNALRKEYYKQLLMLRELVGKQRNDPRTLKALEDVIATVLNSSTPGTNASSAGSSNKAWLHPPVKRAEPEAVGKTGNSTMGATGSALRKEKEKWEERARETAAECQQLQEQILVLKQQLEEARGLDGELWFATQQHGLYERQRIIDSVYKSKCSWEQVGDSILELLNNELVWEAVEDSAFREKTRVSRGLEALILRAESVGVRRSSTVTDLDVDGGQDGVDAAEAARRTNTRRYGTAFQEGSRVIMCRTCNGCGYLDASAVAANSQAGVAEQEDDSYLRKTLAQVLELKASLEEANNRTNQVEQQLLRTVMEGAQIKETLEKIESARAHSVDSCLQTDLDDEEEIDVDEIMTAYSSDAADPSNREQGGKRRGGRWKQYEHLIVELKNLLSERDGAIAQLRTGIADAQTRLVTVQKTSQQEQDRLQRELQTLKGSLALAMSNRNEVIEEKQAAVSMLLKNMERKKSHALPSKSFLLPRPSQSNVGVDDGETSIDSNNDSVDVNEDEESELDEKDEVKRSEIVARRYSEAVGRVQREHEEQQHRLKQTEDDLGQDSDKRKRTNSIMLGNIAVTMTSHPRDLFKALSNTHQELLNYRRSSQRSSALQTDRLLTLTTHLAHISEELVMVKKRTSAEIEFWKLDCEKLQNANKALAVDLEKSQKMLEESNDRAAQASMRNAVGVCTLCTKHEERLLAISAQLLQETRREDRNDPSLRPSSPSLPSDTLLTEEERQSVGRILLDLEDLYSTLSTLKQQQARNAVTRALIGIGDDCYGRVAENGNLVRELPESASRTSLHRVTSSSVISSAIDTPENKREMSSTSTRTPVAGLVPSGRLFQSSLLLPTREEYTIPSTPFAVHGSALSTAPSADGLQTHRRKKIVRKVLSEQEALNRQRARARRECVNSTAAQEWGESVQPDNRMVSEDRSVDERDVVRENLNDHGYTETAYSMYVDENGKQVFYVDIEADECDERANDSVALARMSPNSDMKVLDNLGSGLREDISSQGTIQSRRVDLSILIPSPNNPYGGPIREPVGPHKLFDRSSEIEKDPQVIQKLRDLVNHNSRAREALALTNWKILVSHIRAFRDQRRLDYVNDMWRAVSTKDRAHRAASSPTSTLPQAVRTTMQRLVQIREFALDDGIRARDELRKESQRAQAQLIHSVSAVLANLSHKNKPKNAHDVFTPQSRLSPQYGPHHIPSHHAYSPTRPLYPSVRVNLSEIPATQQVSTPTFPLPSSQNAATSPPRAGSPTALKPTAFQPYKEVDDDVAWNPSIFENDNRFPQRSVKFVPAGNGGELSLMHSTSTFHTSMTGQSTTKSPSKAALSVDAKRPTHSAGPVLSSHAGHSPIADIPELLTPATARHKIDLTLQRPRRPQSSPAGQHSRFRPLSATTPRYYTSDELIGPQHSVDSSSLAGAKEQI